MFYAEISADQRPDVSAKAAVDAVEVATRIKSAEYDGRPFVLDPKEMRATVEEALAAVRSARLGRDIAEVPVARHEIAVRHTIHGIEIDHAETIDETTFETTYDLLDDDGAVIDTENASVELIVRLATAARDELTVRSVVSEAHAQLTAIAGDAQAACVPVFWVVDRTSR